MKNETSILESWLADITSMGYAGRDVVARMRGPAIGAHVLERVVEVFSAELRDRMRVDGAECVVLARAGDAVAVPRDELVDYLRERGAEREADLLEHETVPRGDLIAGLVDADEAKSLMLVVITITEQVNRHLIN